MEEQQVVKPDKIDIVELQNPKAEGIVHGIGFWVGEQFVPVFIVKTFDDVGVFVNALVKRYGELKNHYRLNASRQIDVAETIIKGDYKDVSGFQQDQF